MRKKIVQRFFLALACGSLIACRAKPSDGPPRIWLEPNRFSMCNPTENPLSTVYWDTGNSGVTDVDVYVTNLKGVDRKFANASAVGNKGTGPWVVVGIRFSLRDHVTGREIAHAKAQGKPCPIDDRIGGAAATGTSGPASLSVHPDTFENCTPPVTTTALVRWDAGESGAARVNIVAIQANGTRGIFASAGPVGEKRTGPWMGPNVVLAMNDADTGKTLASAVAKAKPCAR